MLNQIHILPNQKVLEIGVGTARNLLKLYKREIEAHYYGVDVSKMMLELAEKKVREKKAPIKLKLLTAPVDQYITPLGLNEGFDHIILSFCLTMIPDPVPVLQAALASLRPGGTLHIADYYDLAKLPPSLKKMVQKMTARYHVLYRPEVLAHLQQLPGKLSIHTVLFHVAYCAHYTNS